MKTVHRLETSRENDVVELEQVADPEELWDLLGRNLSLLGAAGVTVPFADAMIATLGHS